MNMNEYDVASEFATFSVSSGAYVGLLRGTSEALQNETLNVSNWNSSQFGGFTGVFASKLLWLID